MFLNAIIKAWQSNATQLAVLIDPDKTKLGSLDQVVKTAIEAKVDYFLIGGSLILNDRLEDCISYIKSQSNIPVILFPGSTFQICDRADAILFLSLISGRNPEMLIGKHVTVAPYLKRSGLEVVPTGYILVDGGAPTTASYISNSLPIPANKTDVAACTAMAGELLGLKMIYMDAGSGAQSPIPENMIKAVRETVDLPIIIGGGIKTPERAYASAKAGASLIVIGNSTEKNPALIHEIKDALTEAKTVSDI